MKETVEMEVLIVNTHDNGGCNCCSRGKLSEDRKKLEFPYKEVVRVTGKHQSMNFCKECFELLTGMKYDQIKRENTITE